MQTAWTPPSAEAVDQYVNSVLVVDDDLTSRMMLETILSREGFQVAIAADSIEGRQIAEREKPDLVLMDVVMPGENGFDACRALKANPATADLPVVFISSVEDAPTKVQGFQAGGVDYITKPYDPIEVLARVKLHIRLNHAYQSLVSTHLVQIRAISQSQKILLPSPNVHPDAKFACLYLPCQMAGGDFYDVLPVGRGITDYMVADISGHDLGTALPTAALKALIHQNAEMLFSPLESIQLLNRHLRPVLAESQYVTLLYARLNRNHNELMLLNAGHPPALLVPRQGEIQVLSQPGDALGLFDNLSVEAQQIGVSPGDRLLLITDGLIEQGPGGMTTRRVGMERLLTLSAEIRDLPLHDWPEQLAGQLLPTAATLVDDVIAVCIEV
jgi:phosphoserine phosphatase RsbU/P